MENLIAALAVDGKYLMANTVKNLMERDRMLQNVPKDNQKEENACLENITYEDLERLQRQGLITNGRLACRIDVLGMFFR